MCGIAGIANLHSGIPSVPEQHLHLMNTIQKHRGPDGCGVWCHPSGTVGLAHRRLSIIDLSSHASQPMTAPDGSVITFNGEIYNFPELRKELGEHLFRTASDTEVILRAYEKWGEECVHRLRGMFAFALWDERNSTLFCARDRFGIKPFYYTESGRKFLFASEIKALLPFLPEVATDCDGMKDYLTFQFCLAGKTLFKGVQELQPGHTLTVKNGTVRTRRYWDIRFEPDFTHTEQYFQEKLSDLLHDSVRHHLRGDVSVGAYVSGGLDSSSIAAIASGMPSEHGGMEGFTGKFSRHGDEFDESRYARDVAAHAGFPLHEVDITVDDFIANIRNVIWHLDFPVAGPGSFSQYMVSRLAATRKKVVLGGQGGDEIFGGYARYLIAYFEQCIKGAIDGTIHSGNFIVTYESIIPNLTALKNYKPMLQEFWRDGLFEPMDKRYFRLIDRAPALGAEVNRELLEPYSPWETFSRIFNGNNVRKESYFDLMTHFDFKTLLPALLHIEDRMSMAHGLESRVPLLDHPIVELSAQIPSNIKFKDGNMKHIFKQTIRPHLPESVWKRTDKMGFPTPLTEWMQNGARDFVMDTLTTQNALQRSVVNNRIVADRLNAEPRYGRKIWGFLCLEIWMQEFHDKQHQYRAMLNG